MMEKIDMNELSSSTHLNIFSFHSFNSVTSVTRLSSSAVNHDLGLVICVYISIIISVKTHIFFLWECTVSHTYSLINPLF